MDSSMFISLKQQKNIKKRITLGLSAIAVVYSFVYLQVNPLTPFITLPTVFKFFGENFFPPNFTGFSSYISLIIETLLFAVIGTYISAFLSFSSGY